MLWATSLLVWKTSPLGQPICSHVDSTLLESIKLLLQRYEPRNLGQNVLTGTPKVCKRLARNL